LILAASLIRTASNLGIIFGVILLFWPIQTQAILAAAIIIGLLLVLVFSMAVPLAWARYAGEKLVARTLWVMWVGYWILWPITKLLHPFDIVVRRLAGVPDMEDNDEHVEEEILSAVSEGEREGVVNAEEREMIESVMRLDEKQADDVMTPRTEVKAVNMEANLAEVLEVITLAGVSRLPVYKESIDNVVGILYAKDLLPMLKSEGTEEFRVEKLMRPAIVVPETKPIPDLLRDMKKQKVHMAIVLDEYGGTAGLVTVEDILEEIVGDIADEYELPEPEPIVRLGPDQAEIDARLRIDELNDEMGTDLPEDADIDTVGGFAFATLGRIPRTGETFSYMNVKFTILAAEPRRIKRLRVEVDRMQAVKAEHE
jgi:CBS domain containing-hemolysin-like protein